MKKFLTVAMSAVLAFSVGNFSAITTASADTAHTIGVFDENTVQISFAAITDVHSNKAWGAYADDDYCIPYLEDAFEDLMDAAEVHDADGLDLVMITGDVIDNSVNTNNKYGRDRRGVAEMNAFADGVLKYKNSTFGNNVLITTGNHDTRTYYSSFGAFKDLLGDQYYESNGIRTDARIDYEVGYRHSYITKNGKNYHFIMIEPVGTIPWFYQPLALDYLEADLAAITAEDPNSYIYIGSHIAMWDTIHGSEDNWDPGSNKWHTDGLMKDPADIDNISSLTRIDNITYTGLLLDEDGKAILDANGNEQYVEKTVSGFQKGSSDEEDADGGSSSIRKFTTRNIITKYPQVMVFSGHTHNTLVGERSIMQKHGITSVNAGGVIGGGSYGYDSTPKPNTYGDYINSHNGDKQEYRKGVLIQVDIDGDVRLSRVDFSDDADPRGWSLSKTPWELPRPELDGSNLTVYDYEGRIAKNKAPVLTGTVTVGSAKNSANGNVNVTFSAGLTNDVDEIAYYEIKAYKAGTNTLVKTFKVRADYVFAHIGEGRNNLPTSYSHDIELTAGSYDIKVQAFDEWNLGSQGILTATYTVT